MAQQLMKESESGARVRDDVNPEIQAVLQSHATPLKFEDFDLRAKQCLHAIHCKGGKKSVKAALAMVASWSAGKTDRQSVQSWPAYVGAILRRFLDQFEPQITDVNGKGGRMYICEWKKPISVSQQIPTRNRVAPASSPSKKWWQDMSTQQLNEAKGKQAGLNILASLKGGKGQDKRVGASKHTADWSQPGASDICALKHSHKKWQTQWVDTKAEFDLNDGSQDWWWAGCGPSGDWSASDMKRTQKQWQNSWAESGVESSKRGARRSIGGSSSTWTKSDRSDTKATRKSLNGRDEDTWEPRLRRASGTPKKTGRPSVSTSPQKPRRGSVAVTPASSNQNQTPPSRSRRATVACAQPTRENSLMDTPKTILSSSPLAENGPKLRRSIGTEDSAINRQLFMTDGEISDVEEPITNIGEDRAKELPKTSRTRSYCTWLNARQPLWRFDPVGDGWAWDGPQSKAEKRELLHLSLFAENDVLKSDNYSLNSERAALCDEVEFLRAELEKYAGADAPAPR